MLLRSRVWVSRVLCCLGALTMSLALFGCDEDDPAGPSAPENLPPTTYVAVAGDSTSRPAYDVELLWWGSDPDGEIQGYAYRWTAPWSPLETDSLWWEDSTWVFTTRTQASFDLPLATNSGSYTFEVLAIDDQRLAGEVAASLVFHLTNESPTLAWADSSALPPEGQATLPVMRFEWSMADAEGSEALSHTRLWLDTVAGEDSSASAVEVPAPATSALLSREQIGERYGQRTVYAQVFDVNLRGSRVISCPWEVKPPDGDYLLVDNAGGAGQAELINRPHDGFWKDAESGVLARVVGENYHLYDVWEEGVFEDTEATAGLFDLFEGIVWYGGRYTSATEASTEQMRAGLHVAEEAMRSYASAGGRILIAAGNVMGVGGGLSNTFLEQVAGVDQFFLLEEGGDWVSDLRLARHTMLPGAVDLWGIDALQLRVTTQDADLFRLGHGGEAILWVSGEDAPSGLSPAPEPDEALHAGVVGSYGAGRITLFSILLSDLENPSTGVSAEADVAEMIRAAWGL